MKYLSFISVITFAALALSCKGVEITVNVNERNFVVTSSAAVASSALDLGLYNSGNGRRSKSCFVFPETGTPGKYSTRLGVPEGTFAAICYNFDMQNSFVGGINDFAAFRIYTSDVSELIRQRCMIKPGERLCNTPDAVVCGIIKGIEGSSSDDCIIEAEDILEHWYVEVKVEGAQYVSSAGALIGGMAPDVFPANGFTCVESGYVWTALEVAGNCIRGNFSTFGADSSSEESLTLSIVDNSGKPYLFKAAGKTLFSDARNKGTYSVIPAETIVVPASQQEPSSGDAFTPTMGDWKTDQAEIII